MIDNLELIKPLLNFENEGDFYMLYVFKRKKDQTTDKANHQSVRTIKTYCVESIEYLEKRYEEIKQLCDMFKSRAYIHIQKQNHHDVSLEMMVALATKAEQAYDDLMDLGMNVEVRYASRIFEVASSMLGHAITAKSNKVEKKLKAIDIQLKKYKIDKDNNEDPNNVLNGQGYIITDRNELIKKLGGKE